MKSISWISFSPPDRNQDTGETQMSGAYFVGDDKAPIHYHTVYIAKEIANARGEDELRYFGAMAILSHASNWIAEDSDALDSATEILSPADVDRMLAVENAALRKDERNYQ